jgi:hypothetical protein
MRILIIGGYGTFGGRLAELLKDEPRLTLLIAGRSRGKAAAFCSSLGGAAAREAHRFDREEDCEAQLRALSPALAVDASGPFQAYGAAPYRLVEAAIVSGIDYMDLADGSDFVRGVEAFDAAARAKGVAVLAGVSSFPVLTAAVARRLSADMAEIETITGGIAPSPYAGVGLNVIRAIASYAGKPIERHSGASTSGHALTETRRMTICPPGRLPLKSTLFSLVDVPDLKELPRHWPAATTVWMGAGPVPELLHRALIGLSWLVRIRILPSLSPAAPIFHWATNTLRWGEHRGGMIVRVTGRDGQGRPIERSWHLLAEGDHGPLIPSMAVEALVRKRLSGHRPSPGARAATTDLELADYEALFARRTIATGVHEAAAARDRLPLYRRMLGQALEDLPAEVRRMHDLQGELIARGTATVERGQNPLARLAAFLFGFPEAGEDVPVEVRFLRRGAEEVWTRIFAGRPFRSVQSEGRGRSERLLEERFGPFSFGLALVVDAGRLRLVPRRWRFLGLPLPLALAPKGEAHEHADDGRFHFHVEIALPVIGRIVRYRGHLEPLVRYS